MQRHYWWRSVLKLTAADNGVDEHKFLNELLEVALTGDQLNIAELEVFEIVARRLQLWEEVYAQRLRQADAGASADAWLDERALFLGQGRSRGQALVCPELEAFVATKLAEESAVMKERRKGREERQLASGLTEVFVVGASGGGMEAPPANNNRKKKGKNKDKGGADGADPG